MTEAASPPPAARKNPARRVLVWAAMIGFALIFARVLTKELEASRYEKGCNQGDIKACFNLCVQRPEVRESCARVHSACDEGNRYACGAVRYLERHPPRPRW
ncbi:MAG: hypothetical protein H6718_03555 [Polyangiaceae bacterium]|nr:hypothetical protein [Polyangiaceae bacterium]MCB9609286.1 hypothetical protein [Polyangiaceae bacterium]